MIESAVYGLSFRAVNVLVDAGFYSLISSTFQKVTGLLPIDQSDMKSGTGLDTPCCS